MDLIKAAAIDIPNTKVTSTKNLIADFAHEVSAIALIRGLRHVSDFEYEFQMAMMNYHLNPEVSTILLIPDEKYIHLNSTVIKDIVRLNGDVSDYVPALVLDAIRRKQNS